MRFALRSLRNAPAFSAVAIATLALGIGANTAIFTVVDAVLLNPIPYRDPDRLVSLSESHLASPGLDRLSIATARDLLRRSRTLDSVSFYNDGGGGRLLENGEAEVLRGQRVSPGFFDTLGIRPYLGRTFLPADRLPGHNDVIVLSHALWKRRFGADPNIIGRPLHILNGPARVIGVLPPTFHPLHMSNPGEMPQVFRCLTLDDLESQDRRWAATTIARLKPGVAVGQARAELNGIMRDLIRELPADYPRTAALVIQPLSDKLTEDVRTALWILLAAVGFVLLIACANVTSLLLARANERATEIAVRAALGCGRVRLVRQILAENLVLCLLGGAAGVFLAWAGTHALVALAPAEIPRAGEIRMNATVLVFALLASILTAALIGIGPALRAMRLDLNAVLRGSRDAGGGRSARRVRDALVVAQIASAFILAIGAGLLARSLDRLLHVNAGYDPRHILTMTAFIYDDTLEQRLRHYQRIVERVRQIPGVQDAAMISTVPLSSPQQDHLYIEGRALPNDSEAPVVDQYFATPGYFHLMRIPLRRGRFFTNQDGPDAPKVALTSESCARSQFPNEDPIGRRIAFGDRSDWAVIVGVVGDVWQHGMDGGPSAGVYIPQAQHPNFYYRLLVRTPGDPWRFYPAVRAALRELDPNQPMFHVQPMDDYVTKSLAGRIFALSLIGILGAHALVLAAVGIYGVVSYTVSLRTREVGIRMALGADRSAVLRLVMKDMLAVLAAGLTLGLLASLALTRSLAHLLYGIQPRDPANILTAALALSSAALLAALIPCRRALAVKPSTALRDS